jgi:hypothetical protein
MGHFTEQRGKYDEDGHPKRGNEVYTDTVHPQKANPEVNFVGSSTVKKLNPNGSTTNTPNNFDKVVPTGAKVEDGVVVLNTNNPPSA